MTDAPSTSPERASTIGGRQVLFVLVLTFFIRLAVICLLPAGLSKDTDGYRRIAVTLRTTGTYGVGFAPLGGDGVQPTAYRPPLYPVLLSLFVVDGHLSPMVIGGVHIVLGCATVALVLWLGQAWGLGRWSLVAAILTACDPILLYQSAQIMTETLATFLAVVALACLAQMHRRIRPRDDGGWHSTSRRRLLVALCAGIALGLTCLCRPTFLPWCVLVAASLLPFSRTHWKRRSMTELVALVCGIIVALAPWGVRNYLTFQHFTVSTTHGGYTLLLGNNPSFYRYLRDAPWGAVWLSDELDAAWTARGKVADGEFGDDQLAYRWAQENIRAEPLMFGWACCVRIARLWNVLPHRISDSEPNLRRAMRMATAVWYSAIFALAIVAIGRYRARLLEPPWLWGVLLCLTFTAVHTLYWSDMRMRAPIMPFIYLVAAAGVLKGRRSTMRLNSENGLPRT
jgi:4-amino-4-deoxy-L-arabinose transferase-like glycosyltransferase